MLLGGYESVRIRCKLVYAEVYFKQSRSVRDVQLVS